MEEGDLQIVSFKRRTARGKRNGLFFLKSQANLAFSPQIYKPTVSQIEYLCTKHFACVMNGVSVTYREWGDAVSVLAPLASQACSFTAAARGVNGFGLRVMKYRLCRFYHLFAISGLKKKL